MLNSISNSIGIGLGGSQGTASVVNTVTPVTVKGGVTRVIDSATGDIARTTDGWIEDEKYGIYTDTVTTATSAEFDSAITRTGRLTLKLSSTDTTGRVTSFSGGLGVGASQIVSNLTKYGIQAKPSTSYRLNCYAKTNNVATASVFMQLVEYNAAGTRLVVNATNTLTGTQDFSLLTKTITTNASTAYFVISYALNVAGNISDAWFDVNSMTLEEVSSITNSGSFPALLYPKATAVTSTDNIDQSMVTDGRTNPFGQIANKYKAEQFLPTKKYLTGVTLKNFTATGTFVGNVTVSIQADNAGKPSGVDLIAKTYTSAEWIAFGTAEFNVLFASPITLTVDGSTKYWIVKTSSTADDSNYANERASTSDVYTSGLYAFSANGSTWTNISAQDLYFKTLYSKNTDNFTVSTDTQTVTVTAPTTDGWANGTVIDTSTGAYGITPLTLAPGANNVYYSSNGPSTADGTVDPSLQATISGTFNS